MVTQEQFVSAIVVRGDKTKTVNSWDDFQDALAAGWKEKTETAPTNTGNRNSRGAAAPRTPRPNIDRNEARKMTDERLKNRIGIPAALAEYCKSQGEQFNVKTSAKINHHAENWSARSASFYPVSQVTTNVNGAEYTFCVLFVDVDPGATVALTFSPDAEGITRSGVLCDVAA